VSLGRKFGARDSASHRHSCMRIGASAELMARPPRSSVPPTPAAPPARLGMASPCSNLFASTASGSTSSAMVSSPPRLAVHRAAFRRPGDGAERRRRDGADPGVLCGHGVVLPACGGRKAWRGREFQANERRLPPYPGRVLALSAGDPLHRQGKTAATRWTISTTSCCRAPMRAVVFPGLADNNASGQAAMPSKSSRTRRHTQLKRHQPAVGRLWGNKWLIAYLARCASTIFLGTWVAAAMWSTERFGSASRAWPADRVSMPPWDEPHTRPHAAVPRLAGMVAANRPDIARVAATSPTWA
jgi:hypothetical protein